MTNLNRHPTFRLRGLRLWGHSMAAGVILCASAGAARAEDWGTPGLDTAHSRLSAERSGASFGGARWSRPSTNGGRVLASPVAADGFVVTVDLDGVVSGLRAEDGTPVWRVAAGSTVYGTPAVARGRVFVPTFGNKVVALRLVDGSVLWTSDTGGAVQSSPTPIDGDVVVGVGVPERKVLRLSGETGAVVWQSADVMQQASNTSPAVGGGLVVVGTNGGRYHAFDAATGAARWEYVADGLVHVAAPIIAGGRVFMAGGGDSDRVHAVDAQTGVLVAGWPVDLPTPAPDIAGTVKGRHRAISSFASAAGMLLLQTRLDVALDTNGDGGIDKHLLREMVLALDVATGQLSWQVSRGRAEVADVNDVPKFLVCPTPAAYGTAGGAPLVVSASTLEPTIVALDPTTGHEQARMPVAGVTLASPVLANGRLYSVAIDGTVEGLGSGVNRAPAAAIPAGGARPSDAADLALHWLPATDPDGEIPSYELRIDSDGEVLQSWQQQIFLAPGSTSAPIAGGLQPGVTYAFAVRARDSHGALSEWSAIQTFTVVENPPVTVGGTPARSLVDALAVAQPGSVIQLGPGTYTLSDTLHVRGGVLVQGAGAGRTILDATGLAVGVSFDGSDANHRTGLDGVTLTGAETCARVGEASTGVALTHVIVRDCRTGGVAVALKGSAEIANATFVGNGTAVSATGSTRVKNSLLTGNVAGLSSATSGALASAYNDLFDNQTDYEGLRAGPGDFAMAVTFADLPHHDLRLAGAQPSTDKGDPADPVGDEPAPNGGRINLGAFGGTADAEASAPSTVLGGPGAGASPTADPATPPASGEGGCSVAGPSELNWVGLCLLLAFSRRRRLKPRP